MSGIKTWARSFAAGEVAPTLYGRLDLTKYQTGLSTCRNFIVLPQGPVRNRPGFCYTQQAKFGWGAYGDDGRCRLFRFVYNDEQAIVIEAGANYFRFFVDGAALLEDEQDIEGFTSADPGVFTITGHDYDDGDWVYLDETGEVQLDGRYFVVADATADTFTLKTLRDEALDTTAMTFNSSGTAERVFELETPYAVADLFDIHYTQSADVVTFVHPSYPPTELRRLGALNWTLEEIEFGTSLEPPSSVGVVATSTGVTTFQRYYYAVTSLDDNLEESDASEIAPTNTSVVVTSITNANPGVVTKAAHGMVDGDTIKFSGNVGMTELNNNFYTIKFIDVDHFSLVDDASQPVDTTTFGLFILGFYFMCFALNDLSVAGTKNVIQWQAVTGATRYNVYRRLNGLFGFIGQVVGLSFTDDNIVPDLSQSPPVDSDPFSSSDNYPGAVGYREQRRVFGGTNNEPQTVWLTRSGTESNLSRSIPARDDDAIVFRVKSSEVNRIRHVASISEMILLHAGGIARITAQNSDALTPLNVTVKPDSYDGSSNVQPVLTGNSIVYNIARGGSMRELKFDWQTQGYSTSDISILAPHLFDGYTVVDIAYGRLPNKTVWVVRSDGRLLGLTYLPEQEVAAWHQHDTGLIPGDNIEFQFKDPIESAVTVPDGTEDALTVVVRRQLPASGTSIRYIETMHTRDFADAEDAFFVDSGLRYDGPAVHTIVGLWHLEGETVTILADGAVVTPQVVTDGMITLEVAAAKVSIGLPITADVETLPMSMELRGFGASMQANVKNIDRVWLRVYKSSGFKVGQDTDHLEEPRWRSSEPYGSPPDLITDDVEIMLDNLWVLRGTVFLRQTQPLPITLLAMASEVALGG